MQKWILILLLCFGLFGCVSNNKSMNTISPNTGNTEHEEESKIMNPYKYYNLEKTQKIEIQMFWTVELAPHVYGDAPQEKILLHKNLQRTILKELNKEIEYIEFCLCGGDGNIIFTLIDGSVVEFRVKHCGGVLETVFDESRNFKLSENFEKIIRKYYPESGRYFCKIDDRFDSGEISEEQRNKEWDEFRRLYQHSEWISMNDDPVIKDAYLKKTITGSWEIQTEYGGEEFHAIDTFSVDGEVWHRGDIKTTNGAIPVEMKSDWKIKDGVLITKLKTIDSQNTIPIGSVIKNEILYMSDKFIELRDENGETNIYKKIM